MRHSIKNFIKRILQKVFGFETYLFIFSFFTYTRLRMGLIEKEFLHFIRLIQKDGIILDIGANIGVMTLLMARRFKNSSVYAFEPIPECIRVFKKIIKFFRVKNVQLFEAALSNKTGKTTMLMPVVDEVKMQGLSRVVEDGPGAAEEGEIYTVPVLQLDKMDEFKKPGIHISAIKLDVENYEYQVLQGGRELIKKHTPVIYCELWETQNRIRTLDMMSEMGYKLKVLHKGKLTDYKHQPCINFIFIPPDQFS